MKKIPDISLTIFCKGFSSIISMGSQETELFSLIPEAALTSEQVSFLSTGIFFQNLCFLFSHLRGVPRIRFQRHPHLALPWPTETEFSLHKHMIILTTTPSTAAQMLLWTEHVHKRCKSTMSFASLLLPLFSFTIKQLRVKRIINAIKHASFKNSLILVNALMEQ